MPRAEHSRVALHRLARVALLVVSAVLAGCDTPGEPAAADPPAPREPASPPAAPPPTGSPAPAGPTTAQTEPLEVEPEGGFHLDDVDVDYREPAPQAPPRDKRRIHLTLRSTPPGATAAIDGEVIGRTPTYWEGAFKGESREFTFVLPGYVMARYRFVPTTDGIVHGQLQKVRAAPPDAGPLPAAPDS